MSYSEPHILPFKPVIPPVVVYPNNPFPDTPLLPPRKQISSASRSSIAIPSSHHDDGPPGREVQMQSHSDHQLPSPSFSLFPLLPPEIRLKIWRHTFPTSRVVIARPTAIAERFRYINDIKHKKTDFLFTSPSLPPVALEICRESRAEASRYYRLCFGFADYGSSQSEIAGRIYFRVDDEKVEGDVLYFEFSGNRLYSNLGYFTASILGEGCMRREMGIVRRVALSHRLVKGRPNALFKVVRRLMLFEKLEEVIVALERVGQYERGGKGEIDVRGEDEDCRIVVAREASLVDMIGKWDDWDELTREVVKEVEQVKAIWEDDGNVKGWKGRGCDNRPAPRLKVMEIEHRASRRTGRVKTSPDDLKVGFEQLGALAMIRQVVVDSIVRMFGRRT